MSDLAKCGKGEGAVSGEVRSMGTVCDRGLGLVRTGRLHARERPGLTANWTTFGEKPHVLMFIGSAMRNEPNDTRT